MGLDEVFKQYIIGDGQFIDLKFSLDYQDFEKSTAAITLLVRKKLKKKGNESCKLQLQFSQLVEVCINDNLGTIYYSDVVLEKLESGDIYLSLDPYGNSGKPHKDDNMVIIAKRLNF